ncbi:uncharacterized protein FTOL_10490 [Fusarium torulosum]|uniref:Apple domain-containing protein n=1 Tax=Fusarium torulosum TaxID=33205 RepID=A0AAE8MHH3_9HYPO|nr:uncharacterized protein FTOL_10490 [Fusarium torulosum]
MVAFKSLLVLLTLGAEALAGPAKPDSSTCTTFLGSKTVKSVPTARTTTIKNVTIIKKVIRKVNVVVVPRSKTTTVRTTKTDTITHTDDSDVATVTVTSNQSTKTNTRTAWVTRVYTSYTTTTKSFTSTVTTTPVGYTAILDDTSYRAKRDLPLEKEPADDVTPIVPDTLVGGDLPQSVHCVKDVPKYSTKTVTTNVQGPRRTLKAVTKTKTLTSFTTVVSTVFPEATSTTTTTEYREIITTDVDVTSTSALTETVTVESWIPQATVYDICSRRNMMRSANGGGSVITYRDAGGVSLAGLGTGFNEVSCCNACAADPYCRGTQFSGSNTACYAYVSRDRSQCTTARNLLARYVTYPFFDTSVYSNGPCGYWENGGQF